MVYKHSESTKQKISDSLKGKKLSIETRNKKSKALKGKTYEDLCGREKAIERKNKLSESLKGENNPMYGRHLSDDAKIKISKYNTGKKLSEETKQKISKKLYGIQSHNKYTIQKIKNKYPFFSKIEEMRYKPDEKEIQVHCKNHNCTNSKEQGGWFTPSRYQLSERIRQLENDDGNGGSYFYCSDECKNNCPLYGLQSDPFKANNKLYTDSEYQTFREFVLKRDNYKCQYCGKKAEHIHHERPQKIEPFFALDPDLAWSVCKKCHYKYGHRDECSTGKLANIICG